MWQGRLDIQRRRSTKSFFVRASHFLGMGTSLQWLRACWVIQKKNRSPLKSGKNLKSGTAQSASPSRPPRYPCAPPGFGYPRPLLDSARDRGLSGRRLTHIAIAVSNVAIWGILLAIAQDVFLNYCVINFSAP